MSREENINTGTLEDGTPITAVPFKDSLYIHLGSGEYPGFLSLASSSGSCVALKSDSRIEDELRFLNSQLARKLNRPVLLSSSSPLCLSNTSCNQIIKFII